MENEMAGEKERKRRILKKMTMKQESNEEKPQIATYF